MEPNLSQELDELLREIKDLVQDSTIDSSLEEISWEVSDENFKNIFDNHAIGLIQRLSIHLRQIYPIYSRISQYIPMVIPELNSPFEQQLAMHVYLGVTLRYSSWKTYSTFLGEEILEAPLVINFNEALFEMNGLVLELMYRDFYNPNQVIQHMLDGYPISILANVCRTTLLNAHRIGEAVRRLIANRIFLDSKFQTIVDGHVPLTGDPRSPLTRMELEALCRYLKTTKEVYIHILLQCLFEFANLPFHRNQFNIRLMTEEEIVAASKSTCFHLLQL